VLLRRILPLFGTADARTGLPKNRACLLIVPQQLPEGDLRGEAATGGRSKKRAASGSKKEATRLRDKNKWRQTAHKIYRTPSLITFAKPKRH
jgi:hypothetical protein